MRHALTILLTTVILSIDAAADNPYLNKDEFRNRTQYDDGYQAPANEYQDEYQDEYQGDYQEDGYQGDVYPDQEYPNQDYPGQDYQQPADIYEQIAYEGSGGECQFKVNPHSYACTKMTFGGRVFDLFNLDWYGALQGEWHTVTYVNQRGNDGKSFYMAKNPRSPTQPLGVFNVSSNTPVGSMWIDGDRMVFQNWQGIELVNESIEQLDQNTVRLIFREGRYSHSLNCRDFNRNNNHHLLCAWDVKSRGNDWVHQGYIGFLFKHVWDEFLRHGVR